MRRALTLLVCLSAGLATIGLTADGAFAADYPEPSPYPISWELDFRHEKPKRIVVQIPGQGNRAYLYLKYSVTNNSKQDQTFLPVFEMVTRDGKILKSDQNIPQKVFDTIKKREANRFLEPHYKIGGNLRVGEDQARDGVAIWPVPMTEMGNFSIYVSGLSGETVTLKKGADGQMVKVKPERIAEELKGVKEEDVVILRKTLQLNYVVYGDELYPGLDEVNVLPQQWVMR
jgi:hypothetical protein